MASLPYPTAGPRSAQPGAGGLPYPTSGAAAAASAPAASAAPPDTTEYHTPVQLYISCTNLLDKDILSKSDPVCVVDMLQGSIDASRGQFREAGRTEWIKDTLSPQFARAVTVDYYFEEVQHLRFLVFDVDDERADVRRGGGELLGEAQTQLSQIVSKSPLTLDLVCGTKKGGAAGKIKIVAEEVNKIEETLAMTWSGTKLDKMDFFGKSDPYLEFARENPDGSFSVTHRTEVIKSTLNPAWKPISVSSRLICNSDDKRKIRILCQDWNKNGTADLIGAIDTTLGDLRQVRLPHDLEIVNKSKQAKKKSYRNSGTLQLRTLKIIRNYSFLDYLRGGLELNFVVGVDFTGSNGNPKQPNSLHHMSPNGVMNEYQRALWAVGSVCEQYDTDKMFPAYGFGAKVPPHYEFSNIFNLSVGSPRPECHGVSGILAAYQQALSQVQLWGPTNAAPIVSTVADIAEEEHQQLQREKRPCRVYQILLLLTDGILTDMERTKLAVIRASRLPMSVIIVGVGHADFSDMEELDGDDEMLRLGSQVAMRDIVQFVPFSKFATQPPEFLAKEVLAEVPTQVREYMQANGVPVGPGSVTHSGV